ncbi:MAG: response regulator [Chryseolinea sp.]
MKNNFRRNLLIGFNASLVILILSSAASYFSISNLMESSDWVNHTNEVLVDLESIKAALVDGETGQRGFLLTGDQQFLDPYNDSRKRALDSFQKVKVLTTDNNEQQSDIVALKQAIDKRYFYLDGGLKASVGNLPISNEYLKLGNDTMNHARELIERMKERERKLLERRTGSLNRYSSFTPPLIVVAAVIALLITITFYLRVRKDFEERLRLQDELLKKDEAISNRIRIIRGIADQIAQGSYSVRVDDQQSDALGNVGGSLNRMAESLQYSFGQLSDREWLQTGLTKLNEVMLGEKDVDTLCKHIIEFVAEYTNSSVGAIYIMQGTELRATAGYACLPNSRPRIKVGEGALGQSVANRKMVELRDIPAENLSVSFATGEVKPSHIIALPVVDGYAIAGALELGAIIGFNQLHLSFLNAASAGIGIAMNVALNRRKLQELLDETQSQSEELRVQHTEMENMNSELEVQAEKLQASEEELKVQQEELKQANQELEERSRLLEERNLVITERNIDIQHQAEQLTESTRYKSEFLANMSHELRTPLNSILLLSRLMVENQENNLTPDQIEYARVIQSSGNGLLSLIDEILDLSKIESGKMQLEYQMVSIRELAHDMNSLFGPLARDKNIELNVSIADGVPGVMETDRLRLEQIIRNLLSNAIKFTERGSVNLLIDRDQKLDFIKFVVSDSGIGIPLEKQSIIFDAFQQADGSTRRKYGGTGLGLSISRELAKLLNGEIKLTSEVNQGSQFTVVVPLAKATKPLTTSTPVESFSKAPIAQRNENTMNKFISLAIPQNIPDDRNDIGPFDKTILIIEDDIMFAKALLDYTRKQGYMGVVAVRGDEGIELAKQIAPVGILLDLQLPIKSGWDVMEELKSNPETRHIPVHIMSSYELRTESLMKGAIDFINKPVAFEQMQEIFSKIEYALKHHLKKVLIVEENAQHAKALAYYLETFDVNIEIANEIDQAIESFNNRNVDCVILDMGVPDQKSYETLETIKNSPGLENLPIIIFTGKSMSTAEERRIKQYADTIVVKTAHSYKRILDEVSLFLHLMEKHERTEATPPRYHKLGALDEVLKHKTVLIADDDMRNIFSLTKSLEKYDMNVIAAIDGKDALKKLMDHPAVDIVLMDMMMPEMDGYESIRAIRSNGHFKNLPIIAVTAKAMMGDRAKCIEAGASDYITKPVDVDQLFSLLRVWLYEGANR